MYKLQDGGHSIKRLSDGAGIPRNTGNKDYRAFLEWEGKGNTPEPEFTLAEIKSARNSEIEAAGRKRVEAKRREAEYQESPEKSAVDAAAVKIDAAETEAEIEKAFAEAME